MALIVEKYVADRGHSLSEWSQLQRFLLRRRSR